MCMPCTPHAGVYRGHYRTDTHGANLNRHYKNPDHKLHPSIYATRHLIIYHHQKGQKSPARLLTNSGKTTPSRKRKCVLTSASVTTSSRRKEYLMGVVHPKPSIFVLHKPTLSLGKLPEDCSSYFSTSTCDGSVDVSHDPMVTTKSSGLALYIDLHAHAAKRGVFMYGNYFSHTCNQVESMLFPRLVSINSPHFDFEQCVFSERNMSRVDRGGSLTKEGCGRVAVHKATGIIPW